MNYSSFLLLFILIFHEIQTSYLENEFDNMDNMINIRKKVPAKTTTSSPAVETKKLQQKSINNIKREQFPIHPFPLIPLSKKCLIYQDCASPSLSSSSSYKNIKIKEVNYSSWCETSGFLCLQKKCYKIPSKPCSHIEKCNEQLKRCEIKECSRTSDCDDDLFCNGIEKCIKGKCVANFTLHCIGGICSETDKKCTFPSLYSQWNRFKNNILKNNNNQQFLSYYYNNEFSVQHWSNSTQINSTELTVIIVVAIVIVAFILIFLMIAVIGRPFSSTTINTGGGSYGSSSNRYDGEY